MVELRSQAEEAFASVTSSHCLSFIQHCHKYIDSFLQRDEAAHLKQYESLERLIEVGVILPPNNEANESEVEEDGVDEEANNDDE